MSKKWIYLSVFLLAPFLVSCDEKNKKSETNAPPETVEVKAEPVVETAPVPTQEPVVNDTDKISETLGHLIVRHLDNPGFKFNVDKIIVGMKEELEGKKAPMTEEEYEQTIGMIQENLFTELSQKNLEAANAFLEKNAKEEGIISNNAKLQYRIVQEGAGDVVAAESIPLVHYTGKLLDGTVFSSSRETNNPITLPIKQTIPGFSEGLIGMKKGEKRTLYIHPELAYGVSGHLPPNSLLIFDVEILEVDTATAATTEQPKDLDEQTVAREQQEVVQE